MALTHSPEALRAEGIRKSFGSLEVLKGVDLTACKGDVIAIIGGSGSGKSTLLRCLNLLEHPTAGSLRIDGEEVGLTPDGRGHLGAASNAQIRRIRTKLAMVFQSFNLWSHMTLLENVTEVPVRVLGIPRDKATAEAMELLDRVGLADADENVVVVGDVLGSQRPSDTEAPEKARPCNAIVVAIVEMKQPMTGQVFQAAYRAVSLQILRTAHWRDDFRRERMDLVARPVRSPVGDRQGYAVIGQFERAV